MVGEVLGTISERGAMINRYENGWMEGDLGLEFLPTHVGYVVGLGVGHVLGECSLS